MPRILLVEDDILFSDLLQQYLVKKGFEVVCAATGRQALRAQADKSFELALLDYRLPDTNGLDLLRQLRQSAPAMPVLLMTAYSDIRLAIEAMKMGASDYIIKPIHQEELLHGIQSALPDEKNARPSAGSSPKASHPASFVKGQSARSREVQEMLSLVSPTPISVIILGESGTGKEYAARFIHQNSKRSDKPFVAIDCGALGEELAASELFGHLKGAFTGAMTDKTGVFEHANGGTLFLDEIGNLSYEIQVMLLRVLQEKQLRRIGEQKLRPVDVRILVATNEDLRSAVQRGNFREDLYHRLNEFTISLPPLRERKDDLPLFISHFLAQANAELEKNVSSFSGEVLEMFARYDWPGNLREFKNIIKRCVLLTAGNEVESRVLPDEIKHYQPQGLASGGNSSDLYSKREEQEIQLIREVLEKTRYNKSRAALLLNIDRKTLYAKLRKYGLDQD